MSASDYGINMSLDYSDAPQPKLSFGIDGKFSVVSQILDNLRSKYAHTAIASLPHSVLSYEMNVAYAIAFEQQMEMSKSKCGQ